MADDDKKAEGTEPAEVKEEKKEGKEAEKTAEKVEEKAEEVVKEAEEKPADLSAEASAKTEAKEEKPAKTESDSVKTAPKVSKKLESIISEVEKLSVLELSELVKALEDKFGVTAAAPMAAAPAATAAPGAPAGAEGPAEEQTTFNVILANSGANKISVIKAVRELVPTLGLKEAKDLVDATPKEVLTGVNKENANEAKQKLEAAGASVELK